MYFQKSVHEALQSQKGIWRIAKWGKDFSTTPRQLPKFPALKKSGGSDKMTEDFEAKVKVLRGVFFPSPPKADLEDIERATYPIPIDMPEMLDDEKVRKAIWKPKPDKATGIDGLPNRVLCAVIQKPGMLKTFTHLFQACVMLGYHLTEFKKANTIILKKQKRTIIQNSKHIGLLHF